MKTDVKIPKIKIGALLGRFHAILFTIIVGGGLAVAIYLFSNILDGTSIEGYKPDKEVTKFDESAIQDVEKLRKLSETPTRPELPSGRIDPFPQ